MDLLVQLWLMVITSAACGLAALTVRFEAAELQSQVIDAHEIGDRLDCTQQQRLDRIALQPSALLTSCVRVLHKWVNCEGTISAPSTR